MGAERGQAVSDRVARLLRQPAERKVADLPTLPLALTRSRGRAERPVVVTGVGELSLDDIEKLDDPIGVTPTPLKELRTTHHQMAQMVARGDSVVQISAALGFSVSRVSILKSDPTFAELVEFYREKNEELYADTQLRLKNLTDDAVEVLHSRLHDNPDAIGTATLLEIVKSGADRSGAGPSSTLNLKTLHLTAADIAQIKENAIDGSSDHSGPRERLADGRLSLRRQGEGEAARLEGPREGVREEDWEDASAGNSGAGAATGSVLGAVDRVSGPERDGLGSTGSLPGVPGPVDSDRVQADAAPGGTDTASRVVRPALGLNLQTANRNGSGVQEPDRLVEVEVRESVGTEGDDQ